MEESTSKAGKVTQALSPVKLQKVKGGNGENETAGEERGGVWSIAREEVSPSVSRCVPNHPHSKKVMKHALRQQAKRRRKNTTIAAGNSAPLPRPILVPPQTEFSMEEGLESRVRPSTMIEVLNSIPGFTLKPRKRSNKKLSAAAQLEQLQTKEGSIDLETPDSILVQTNLRFLLNKHTFASLPALYQCKLVQLLPHVDRTYHSDSTFRLSASGLNNEFFARALQQWRERLAEGEFTPENQQKLKLEAEKEKSKLDPWKLKHFEPIWGESNASVLHTATSTAVPTVVTSSEWAAPKSSLKATIKIRPPTVRLRTVGAVTRAVSSYRGKREAEDQDVEEQPKRSKSDILQTQTLADLSNHLSETDKDETDYSESCHNSLQVESFVPNEEIVETSINVAGVSGIVPQNISTAEKCSMEVEAASELTCIIPSEEVFNAPPMEMKSGEDLQGHDQDDFIYVDPSTDFNELESETILGETIIDQKDQNLLCPVPAANSSNPSISTEDDSSPVNDGSLESSKNVTNQSDIEETFQLESSEITTSILPLPLSSDNTCDPKNEDSTGKLLESTSVISTVNEGPETESSSVSLNSVDACTDKPSDLVHEIPVPIESTKPDPEKENPEFFSTEDDPLAVVRYVSAPLHCDPNPNQPDAGLNSDCMESGPKDLPETQTVDCASYSPPKLESDGKHLSKSPNASRSSPSSELQSVANEVDFSHQETTPNVSSEPEIFSHSSNFECIQVESYSEIKATVLEGTSANNVIEDPLQTSSVAITIQHEDGTSASESTAEISEIKNMPSNEMSSKGNSPPADPFESHAEPEMVAENSDSVESSANAINTFSSSPLVGNINFKDCSAENSLASPASHLLPDVSVNFKFENIQNCSTNESSTQEQSPLEVCSKEISTLAWDGVDSSTDKLFDSPMEGAQEGEVAVIAMQEELEVRLEESPLPAPTCEWSDFVKSESSTNPQNPPNSVPYPGHVKLELEVTLTPEVDSQVSSTVESSGAVIAPTTIVCLPSVAAPPLPPVPSAAVPSVQSMVSSPALPYLALSTSTPVTAVRAISTKTVQPIPAKTGGPSRGARNISNKPPPGAVNLERSYQICQAVIQSSPNRDQLRSQLKPPPSTLLNKEGVETGVLPSKGNRPVTQTTKPARGHSAQPVLVKHVFTSSQGIPVTMAVLPPTNTSEMTDGGQFLLVQRGTGLSGVRRSSSAPPANNKLPVGSVARNRPASVGIQAITRERYNGTDSPVQNIYNKQQSMDNCSCNLNAMVVCQKCGAFCHDDCISPSRLCLTCLIR